MIPVYIGYDPVEEGAFWTCAASIQRHSSKPVQITPLNRRQLPLERPKHNKQSNEFAFTRFLVPFMQGYTGHAIFVDCDFLFFSDISELYFLRDNTKSVQVAKHSSETFAAGKKYLGNDQTVYEKKCWSSLMLFNCEHHDCRYLSPSIIDQEDGLSLHQFKWTSEDKIGDLPLEWNWLVQHYPFKQDVHAVHFTEGGPYFKDYRDCDYGQEWWREFRKMNYVKEGLTVPSS